ncbi:MAG: Na+/H+ antiporter NhaA [Bacteroidota bacterium]
MSENNTIVLTGYRDLKNKVSAEASKSLRESLQRFGDNVVFGYKYCPDLEKDPLAINAAKGVVSAEYQGKSEELYQVISGREEDYTREFVFKSAEELGISMPQFEKDFDDKGTEVRVFQDIEDSKKSGLIVFPGLTIDGAPYNGAWDDNSLFEAIKKRGGKQVEMAIESFFAWGASAAAVLIIATFAALIMVNMGYHELYERWRHIKSGLLFSDANIILSLEVWINDFLMAIFFLMIGLEIKKEVLDGELSDMKRASMPVIGAVGGMLVPALLYVATNVGAPTMNGWGVPMATDIAFTLGLMALLGSRVPISLKIFISALAVADDLGAIVVIALFYGHGFHLIPFIGALIIVALMIFLNRRKVYAIYVYVSLGLLLWFFIFESGLHATLAGVITAILIPNRGKADLPLIAQQTAIIFNREVAKVQDIDNEQQHIGHGSLQVLRSAIERLREPSDYLMHSLEKVVNFSILPLFAFFNTGILLGGTDLNLGAPVSVGILLGLVVGKPLGIVGACWIASKLKIAQLSSEINWKQLIGASCLAGVGFTMSIVVASSAFKDDLLTASKVSILIASTLSALIGLFILNLVTKK